MLAANDECMKVRVDPVSNNMLQLLTLASPLTIAGAVGKLTPLDVRLTVVALCCCPGVYDWAVADNVGLAVDVGPNFVGHNDR